MWVCVSRYIVCILYVHIFKCLLFSLTLHSPKYAPSSKHCWCLWTGFPKPEIRWWSAVYRNSKHDPIPTEKDLRAPFNPACKMLLIVHVCHYTFALQKTQAHNLPYLPLSSNSTLHTLASPCMPSWEAWREIRWWGVNKEEKEAMIDLSHRHLALSLQLIGPTSIQQRCRLFCVSINTGPNQYLCCTVYLAAVQPFSV